MTYTIHNNDALVALRQLPANSFDALFCDPPYGISFMGKDWDHGVPAPEVWQAAFRALKPGARLAAFAGTRTMDEMQHAIELAGFEVENCIYYAFGSGFPKAQDIGKQIDKQAGVVREVLGLSPNARPNRVGKTTMLSGAQTIGGEITKPVTAAAKTWDGYKTPALKPAYEPLLVFRKPGCEVSHPEITQVLFYGAKASTRERNAGLGNAKNPHPTLKSIDTVQRIAAHILTPGSRVLTPFSGSGSEMIALLKAGAGHVEGIERESEYAQIARLRVEHWL